jgi:bile acid:Na+ symporter, BASS family
VKATLDISILVVNVAMMVAVGMGLEAHHFTEIARRKRLVPAALLGQMVLLPVIGWCIARFMALPPHLCAGILLMAACPVGDIANFYTAIARGNTALSVAVNTLSCLLAALTMAVVFELYARVAGEPFAFAAPPLQLVIRVMLMTAAPIAGGVVLRRLAFRFAARIGPMIQAACIAGIGGIIAMIVVVQADLLVVEWKPAAVASLALMTVAMAGGWLMSALMGLQTTERIAFAVIFSVRNVALAMAVAVTLLGRVEYAAFAVVYFLTEVPLLLGVVAICRRRPARSGWAPCAGATR